MLIQLSIKNLAIVEQTTLNFSSGMHVLTGETGAGKSILLEALNLALGERASPSIVRAPHKQAEVAAAFDLSNLARVQQWLQEQSLDAGVECIVRRIIANDSPSKAYINGNMVTLIQLKQLGEMLVNMHSQHQNHALLNVAYQREILDQYAGHDDLLQQVMKFYQEWHTLEVEYKRLSEEKNQHDRLQLLNYQLQEIEELALKHGELAALEQQHKKLTKAEELLTIVQQVWNSINAEADQNILAELYSGLNDLKKLQSFAPELQSSALLLEQAIIPLEEANTELRNFLDALEIDPAKLGELEDRLSKIYSLSRKHNVSPEYLLEHIATLTTQRDELMHKSARLAKITQDIQIAKDNYFKIADKLHASREKIANKLANQIVQQMKLLSMPHAVFNIVVAAHVHKPTLYGVDEINFLVSTNPGQNPQPLNKIASGGELSRISLAMQIILTEKMQAPTLIFDEIDVGVSGGTAEVVGKLLRKLGAKAQVLCVTHLPQVAAQAHNHFKVIKQQSKNTTATRILPVQGKDRVEELARLLGGTTITLEALANAKAMLEA